MTKLKYYLPLRAELARRGISMAVFGDSIGISPKTVSVRFAGEKPWTLREYIAINKLYGISLEQMLETAPPYMYE